VKKRTLTPIAFIYNTIVFGGFFLWGYFVQKEEGVINPSKHEIPLIIFVAFMLIGVVLAGIDFSGEKEKGKKISRKTVITGVSIAVLFLVWRILMSTF
jgi:hypothetical protein